MKKVFLSLAVVAILAACGAEKAGSEEGNGAKADSIAAADSVAKVKAAADSLAKVQGTKAETKAETKKEEEEVNN